MYLKKLLRVRYTVAFRLTLWYAGVFTVSSIIAFLVFYILMISGIHGRTDEALLDKVKEFSSLIRSQGIEAVKTELVREAKSAGTEKIFFRIIGSNGEEFASSDLTVWENVGVGRTALKHVIKGEPVFETLMVPSHRHKIRILYASIGPDKILQIGKSLKDDERLMEDFREIFGTSMVLVMVLAALIGSFMARRALSGVEEVTRTAIHISKGDLDSRVPVTGKRDEIDHLALTFNHMLERIQSLVNGMREMTDNIAHDLRSPITRIRGVAETSLTTNDPTTDHEVMAGSIVEECDRLLGMINTMLDISEVEAGLAKLTMMKIDITEVVRDACDLFEPIAEGKHIQIIQKLTNSFFVNGDMQKLQRMVANLLDNALKYTPLEGTVTVSVDGDKAQVAISVNDTGIGISEHDLPHVFERFYQSDHSRSQASTGLGLSLALAIARAHGGDITVASFPEKGTTFRVILPRLSCSS